MNPTKCKTCLHDEKMHTHLWGVDKCKGCTCQAFTSSGEDKPCIDCSGKGKIILNQSHVGKPNKLVTCERCSGTGAEPVASESDIEVNPLPKNTDNLRAEGVASESDQCASCGHPRKNHEEGRCSISTNPKYDCLCPKFQPSHSEGETVEQDIDPHADCDDTCHHKQLAKAVCLNCVALRKMGSPGKCFRHDGLVRCPYPDCKASYESWVLLNGHYLEKHIDKSEAELCEACKSEAHGNLYAYIEAERNKAVKEYIDSMRGVI